MEHPLNSVHNGRSNIVDVSVDHSLNPVDWSNVVVEVDWRASQFINHHAEQSIGVFVLVLVIEHVKDRLNQHITDLESNGSQQVECKIGLLIIC